MPQGLGEREYRRGKDYSYADFARDNAKPGSYLEINGKVEMDGGMGAGYGQDFSQPSMPGYSRPPQNSYQKNDKGYGSSNFRPNSNEEITEARQSLVLLKSKMKNKTTNGFRTSASSNMSQNSVQSTGASGGGNYRKVFKPNFGDDSGPSTHSARTAMRQNSNSYGQDPGKPLVKNRLPKKAPYNYRGMSRGEEDSEYHPTERKSGMRSSRISDSRERTKPNIGSMRGGVNNASRASQESKNSYGAPKPKPARGPPKPARGPPKLSQGPTKPTRGPTKPTRGSTKPTRGPSKPSYGAPKQSYGDTSPSIPTTIGGMSHDEDTGVRGGGKRAADIYNGDFGDEAYERPQALKPCPSCGKTFNPESLAKHKKVCQKVFLSKAKKFDTSKQRLIDGEHKEIMRDRKREERKFGGLKSKTKRSAAMPGSKKSKWAKQSNAFRNAMRAARGAKPLNEGFGGDPGAFGGAPDEDDDLVRCPTCNRTFNENAAKRHIISCAERAKQAAMRAGPPRKKPMGKFR